MRRTLTQISAAGFAWPGHDAIEAAAARAGEVIDLAQTVANLEKAAAFHQRQLDEAYAFKQSARASGWVDADYDDFTSTREDHATQRRAHDVAIEYVRKIISALEPPRSTLRLRPAAPTSCGAYALDALVIEHDAARGEFDFRLELGAGPMIYWALPAARDDRLRLVLVDGAAMRVDAEVIEDPFVAELQLAWQGELACFGDEDLTSVAIELSPRGYRFRLELRATSGANRGVELRWSARQGTPFAPE